MRNKNSNNKKTPNNSSIKRNNDSIRKCHTGSKLSLQEQYPNSGLRRDLEQVLWVADDSVVIGAPTRTLADPLTLRIRKRET
jgi:hypothetical protein